MAPTGSPLLSSGTHITLDSCSAITLSLLLNWASESASLTITGLPDASTCLTMLSEMAPAASAMASRRTLRAALMVN